MWFTGLRKLSAGTVGLIGLLNPVTGVLLGTLIAGETLSIRQLCGIALVIAGIVLGQRRPPRVSRERTTQRRQGTTRLRHGTARLESRVL